MTDWVKCPICDEPDMRQEEDPDGGHYIHCVNLACKSNGGTYQYGAPDPVATGVTNLYEILVPTIHRKTNKPITTRFHRVWDKQVYAITGGMTIMPPSKGKWICNKGDMYEERMIPVRIACTKEQMGEIMKMTIKYYDQLAILAYKLSNEVLYLEI